MKKKSIWKKMLKIHAAKLRTACLLEYRGPDKV